MIYIYDLNMVNGTIAILFLNKKRKFIFIRTEHIFFIFYNIIYFININFYTI